MPRGKSQLKDDKMSVAERAQQVAELRARGYDFEKIAKALGYASRGAAYAVYKNSITRSTEANITAIRDRELTLLDEIEASLLIKALKGDQQSAAQVLRVMERRAKYIPGLEAPARLEIDNTPTAEREAEIRARLESLRKKEEPTEEPNE